MFKLRPFNRWQCFLKNWWHRGKDVDHYGYFDEPLHSDLEGINLWNYHHFDPERRNWKLFVLSWSFEGLAYMAKDAVDTFKPYRAPAHVVRDLIAPIHAIGHVCVAFWFSLHLLSNLIGTVTLIFPIQYLFTKNRPFRAMGFDLLAIFEDTCLVLTQLLRAATLFAATPLIWGLKIPFRLILTGAYRLIYGHFPQFEERESIQHMIADGQSMLQQDQIKNMKPLTLSEREEEYEIKSQGQDSEKLIKRKRLVYEEVSLRSETQTTIEDRATMTYIAYRLHQKFVSAREDGQDLGRLADTETEQELWNRFKTSCVAEGPLHKQRREEVEAKTGHKLPLTAVKFGTTPRAFAEYLNFFAKQPVFGKELAALPAQGATFPVAPSA